MLKARFFTTLLIKLNLFDKLQVPVRSLSVTVLVFFKQGKCFIYLDLFLELCGLKPTNRKFLLHYLGGIFFFYRQMCRTSGLEIPNLPYLNYQVRELHFIQNA